MRMKTSLLGFTSCSRTVLGVVALLLLVGCGGAGKKATPFVPLSGGTADVPNNGALPGGEGAGGTPTAVPLGGGVLVTFSQFISIRQPEEVFHVWVTDAPTIAALEAAWAGAAPVVRHIGAWLAAGSGAASHNEPWSWHVRSDKPIGVNVLDGAPVRPLVTGPSAIEGDVAGHTDPIASWVIFCRMTEFVDHR